MCRNWTDDKRLNPGDGVKLQDTHANVHRAIIQHYAQGILSQDLQHNINIKASSFTGAAFMLFNTLKDTVHTTA